MAKLEVIVDRAVGGEELLGMPDRFEPPHVAFAPSGGLVRDLTAVVQISTLPMLNTGQDLVFSGRVGSEFIGHDHSGHVAQAFQQLAKEARGSLRIAAALDQNLEHVPELRVSSASLAEPLLQRGNVRIP